MAVERLEARRLLSAEPYLLKDLGVSPADSSPGPFVDVFTVAARQVNLPAGASNDDYSLDANSTLAVAAPGLLENDRDPEDAELTVALTDNARHGALWLNADGSFSYTPEPGFRGIDRFTYHAIDDAGESGSVATVYLRVRPPQLISNINTNPAGATVSEFLEINGTVYSSANDRIHGQELWKTDGTAEGTALIKDLVPGISGSEPEMFTELNGILFFMANDGNGGRNLWRSDGTLQGTVLVNPTGGWSLLPPLVRLGDRLYLAGRNTDGDWGLWASDGTQRGTNLMAEVRPFASGSVTDISVVNGTMYFSGYDEAHGTELWRSDGTPAGTWLLTDLAPGSDGSFPRKLSGVSGMFYFVADDGIHGSELWKSDGTAEGTRLVSDISPGESSGLRTAPQFTEINGIMYFVADDGTHGAELWRSDGTAAGTMLIKDFWPGSQSSYPSDLINLNGQLYLIAPDSIATRIWRSDGSAVGTRVLEPYGSDPGYRYPGDLTKVGEEFYFSGYTVGTGYELWKSEGTDGGTSMVKDIFPGASSSSPQDLADVNGKLYFIANDGIYGAELWRSDGTEAGTELIRDLARGDAGLNEGTVNTLRPAFTEAGGLIYFGAFEGITRRQLWKTDGTAAGTGLITDRVHGSSYPWPAWFNELSGKLYFTADTESFPFSTAIWTTDGTSSGTRELDGMFPAESFASALLRSAESLYVILENPSSGRDELWRTDAAAERALLIKDFPAGGLFQYAWVPISVDGMLYFLADDGINGGQLWKTNGTASGTGMVTNFIDDGGWYFGSGMRVNIAVNEQLFFAGFDRANGLELWTSDGTSEGTVLVADIWPGSWSALPSSLTAVDDAVYFTAVSEGNGRELWKTDGTAEGTVLVKDIAVGSESSSPSDLTGVDGTLYFVAQNAAYGRELWKTDGTEAGTVVVRDLVPGSGSSFPSALVNADGTLFFSATDGINGVELWKTNGTPAGTRLVADIMPGPDSSSPQDLAVVGQSLIFTAIDGRTGREPWIIPLVVAPWCNPDNPFDVSGDGRVGPLDILTLINYINTRSGETALPPRPTPDAPFYDVTEDNRVTALDVLSLINYLNWLGRPVGEAESVGPSVAITAGMYPFVSPTDGSRVASAGMDSRFAVPPSEPAADRLHASVTPTFAASSARPHRFWNAASRHATTTAVAVLELDELEQALNDMLGPSGNGSDPLAAAEARDRSR